MNHVTPDCPAGGAGRLRSGERDRPPTRRLSMGFNGPFAAKRRAVAGLALLLLLSAALPARAQPVPQPFFPTVEQRSGLLDRWTPIDPWLPQDKYRDTFYDTRWGDRPDSHPNHPNTILA